MGKIFRPFLNPTPKFIIYAFGSISLIFLAVIVLSGHGTSYATTTPPPAAVTAAASPHCQSGEMAMFIGMNSPGADDPELPQIMVKTVAVMPDSPPPVSLEDFKRGESSGQIERFLVKKTAIDLAKPVNLFMAEFLPTAVSGKTPVCIERDWFNPSHIVLSLPETYTR
jgi:hypothetical protein